MTRPDAQPVFEDVEAGQEIRPVVRGRSAPCT